MFPGVAKLVGSKENVLLPRWWQQKHYRKTKGQACAL